MVAQWLRFHHKDCSVPSCMACDLGVILDVYWSNRSWRDEPFINVLDEFQVALQNHRK